MNDEFLAQQRRKNDIVHLYDPESDRPRWGLCANRYGQPSKNNEEPMFDVDAVELDENEYLKRDDEIVGKFCGNCRNIALGEVFSDG